MRRLCVLLPAYNEAESIGRVIDDIPKERLLAMGYETRVIVADSYSTDETAAISIDKGAMVVGCSRGKGTAVRHTLRGLIRRLNPDCVVMLDSDYTYPPNYISIFVDRLNEFDVVIGSRFESMESGAMSKTHERGNRALTWIANLLYRTKTPDLCTGYWGFGRKALSLIRLRAKGFDLEANLFTETDRHKLTLGIIPIYYRARVVTDSKLRVVDGVWIVKRLIQEKFRQ